MGTDGLIECSLTLPPFSDGCCLEVGHLRVLGSSLAGLATVARSQVRRATVGLPTVARSQVRRAIRWLANRIRSSQRASRQPTYAPRAMVGILRASSLSEGWRRGWDSDRAESLPSTTCSNSEALKPAETLKSPRVGTIQERWTFSPWSVLGCCSVQASRWSLRRSS